MKRLTVDIDDGLFDYLEFLERMMFIRTKEEAVQMALALYKRLSMHEWLPEMYRIADSRVVLMDRGMLIDLFERLTEFETYRAGITTALKRKVLKPEFRDVDLTKPANWTLVLKELENLGWGRFTKVENEIKVENCALPILYVRGYLESMFKVELEEHRTRVEGLTVLLVRRRRLDEWR